MTNPQHNQGKKDRKFKKLPQREEVERKIRGGEDRTGGKKNRL